VTNLGHRRDEICGTGASTELLETIAGELYSVAALLVAQPRLRRTLGDPATAPERRAELVAGLFGGKVSQQTVEIAKAAASQRWSSPWDLADALERTGDDTLFASAETQGQLDTVEDELFRFERILDGAGELSVLLDERSVDAQRRVGLLDSIIATKVQSITLQLLRHAVSSDRKRSVRLAIDDLLDSAAARKAQSVARVTTAVELSAQQQERLSAALTELYGRPITVRTAVDQAIRGGLVVRVGDEVIDGSITSRLLQARTALAG
jgi:F-type H+-transporting ATPase subunit delta